MLGRIKETAIDAFSHQDLPFTKLLEELHLKRNPDQSPLFQVKHRQNPGSIRKT